MSLNFKKFKKALREVEQRTGRRDVHLRRMINRLSGGMQVPVQYAPVQAMPAPVQYAPMAPVMQAPMAPVQTMPAPMAPVMQAPMAPVQTMPAPMAPVMPAPMAPVQTMPAPMAPVQTMPAPVAPVMPAPVAPVMPAPMAPVPEAIDEAPIDIPKPPLILYTDPVPESKPEQLEGGGDVELESILLGLRLRELAGHDVRELRSQVNALVAAEDLLKSI